MTTTANIYNVTTNSNANTTFYLPDVEDTTNHANTNHDIIDSKYIIEKQIEKVLNIEDQNTTTTSGIFPNNLDNIIADAVPIWNILGISEQEYYKKYQPATNTTDLSGSILETLVGDVDIQTKK